MKPGYIPKDQRKKIMLMCDDMRFFSGIATMARECVMGTAHHYNWAQLGGSINHPDKGKIADLSDEINKNIGIDDSYVRIYPVDGYGNADVVRQIMDVEKPDMLMIFTDPRYWIWLFQMEAEIRTKVPLIYLEIWDSSPPPLYNAPYYMSCDLLMGISKQTVQLTEDVLTWANHPYKSIV
jgi:hypothetical protein